LVYPEEDTVCRHSLTYTIAVLWKIERMSNLVPVFVEYTYGQLCRPIKGSPVLIQLQHTGISLATVRLLRNPCYHPALFFLHLCLIALSFLQGKLLYVFQNVVVLYFFLFFLFFFLLCCLKLWNFKLYKSGGVCIPGLYKTIF